ncbi:MAG: YraN family protein [Bariatricus sp.]
MNSHFRKQALPAGNQIRSNMNQRMENKVRDTNRRKKGADYELLAGEFLTRQGYRILQYNFRCHSGEIDIIAEKGCELVFCEVKYRSGACLAAPLEAVHPRKQRRISKTALYYLTITGQTERSCRFDVIGITDQEVTWIKNAFDYTGV